MLLLNSWMVFTLKAILNNLKTRILSCFILNGNNIRGFFLKISSHVGGRGSFFLFVRIKILKSPEHWVRVILSGAHTHYLLKFYDKGTASQIS